MKLIFIRRISNTKIISSLEWIFQFGPMPGIVLTKQLKTLWKGITNE